MVRHRRSLRSGSECSYRGCSSWVLSIRDGAEGMLTCRTSMGPNQDWGQTRRNHSSQQGRISPKPRKGWVHVTGSALLHSGFCS